MQFGECRAQILTGKLVASLVDVPVGDGNQGGELLDWSGRTVRDIGQAAFMKRNAHRRQRR
jgi:hypothetical protein